MATVGIDLGTTFSSIAYLDSHGKPVTVPNAQGELTTPSVVLFDKSGEVIVGREARRVALSEPARVAEDVKRFIGDPFFPKLIDGKKLTPPAISALILKKLKQDAETRIGTVDGAVITVPAYFDDGRRQATARAGELAGLKVLDIINEPTAAALAYAYGLFIVSDSERKPPTAPSAEAPPKIVAVYDLGGGTFDVTVLRIKGKDLTVLATAGDVRLGGRDWDERLFNHMADQFLHEYGQDPRDNPQSYQAIMIEAEETKKILSQRHQTRFIVNHAGKSFTGEITREQFVEMTDDLLYRSESRLSRVIEQAGLDWSKVDEVLAVGGSTRMPQVLEMLKRVTGMEPNCSLSPDEAICQGAAIYAAMHVVKATDPAKPVPQLQPLPPAIPTPGTPPDAPATGKPAMPPPIPIEHLLPAAAVGSGSSPKPLIPMGVPVPEPEHKGGLIRMFTAKVVELLRAIKTTNVNAHSLGVVATLSDGRERVSVLIPLNTPLPISVTRRYGTVADNQTTVTAKIVEGESRLPDECIPVGSCQIKQLPAGLKRGSPIDVTFTYDNSGRLHAKAAEPGSGTWAMTTIQRRFGLDHGKMASQEAVASLKVS
jgi:molecular chaperone DnaK